MKREDFVFAVGYDGDTAIIDRKARKRYAKFSTAQLAEVSLYRAAFCSAVFSGDSRELQLVLDAYNQGEGAAYAVPDDLKRLFGVYEVRTDIQKTKAL